MSNKELSKHLVKKYKDVPLPDAGKLLIQKKGPWMGIGYVLGIKGDIFHVDWAGDKNQDSIILPYELEVARFNIGSGKWGLIDLNKK